MRPRINPGWFLLKLVALLVVTYMLWAPLAPYYAVFLLRVSQMAVWLTEFSSDPNWQHPTQMLIKLSVNDLLNQNVGFNRTVNSNFISQNTYTTIRRFAMLSVVWNFTKAGTTAPKSAIEMQ